MSNFDAARVVVESPSASAHDLTSIAQKRPDLWPLIAAHPHAYPSLLAFLEEKGDDAVLEALRSRPRDPDPPHTNLPRTRRPQSAYSSGASAQPRPSLNSYSHDIDSRAEHEPAYPTPEKTRKHLIPGKLKTRTMLYSAVSIGIVLLAIALVSILVVQPRQALIQATDDYEQAVSSYRLAQDSLFSSLRDAIDIQESTTIEQLDDPSLLENLAQGIEQARTLVAEPGDMGETAVEIRDQVNELNTSTLNVRQVVNDLDTLVEDIKSMVTNGVDVKNLALGDCLIIRHLEGRFQSVPRVACSTPHDSEIIKVFEATGDDYVEATVEKTAKDTCTQAMLDYVGSRHSFVSSRGLGLTFFAPSENSWQNGDRTIACLAYAKSERTELTSSVKGKGK
ncbi:MAG: septum formation family protein [Propionibacteriaceae bacterium]|nr:septum formation family protein [Propionibacteriaceae bacterium]